MVEIHFGAKSNLRNFTIKLRLIVLLDSKNQNKAFSLGLGSIVPNTQLIG